MSEQHTVVQLVGDMFGCATEIAEKMSRVSLLAEKFTTMKEKFTTLKENSTEQLGGRKFGASGTQGEFHLLGGKSLEDFVILDTI